MNMPMICAGTMLAMLVVVDFEPAEDTLYTGIFGLYLGKKEQA